MTSTTQRSDQQATVGAGAPRGRRTDSPWGLVAVLVALLLVVMVAAEMIGVRSQAIFVEALRVATGPSAAVYALVAIGLNMHFGYTGLLNFGQVGFMLVGAYGIAIGVAILGWSLWPALLLSVLFAVALALLLGIPTLRLRADYLAITTIAAAEILRFVFRVRQARPVTGGVRGLFGFTGDFYRVNPIPTGEYAVALTQRTLWVLLLAALAAAVLVLASRMAGAWWARAVQPQRAWGALAGTLVGLWLGAGLTVLNPIPAGRYRLLVTTTHARIWGLVVAALIAGALAALARGHGRRGLTERRQSLAGAAAVGVAAAAVLAPAFYAVNPFPDDYLFALLRFSERRLWVVLVGWSLVALACLFVWALMRSPWGRVVKSIREDEDAARSLGKNVFSYKMQSLVIGGVMGAIGGALLALTIQTVQPDTFLPQLTFFAYTVLILGGAARILGPVVGSVVFWFIVAGVDGFLRRAAAVGALPEQYFHAGSIGAVRFAFVGVGLMLLMIYRPQGLLGDRREMQLDVQ